MFFTLEDYRKIEEYLRLNSKKDTDFPTTEEIHDEDYVPIIQDSTNKKMTVLDLRLGLSKGPRGESAYECAVHHGYVGTEEEWLASLDGKSAYLIAVELGYVGTEAEWIASLKGEKGDDGAIPLVRVTSDGMSLEVSYDDGATWQLLVMDFNKLRVIGYVDSVAQLPKNALVGDIYGVWNQEAQGGAGAYELYINTVRDWVEDYTITKVYDYDTELPSSATDGTAVLVPVTELTLDKEKVDGYKVYKYSLTNNGWIMVLNTAEIYAGKEDIINYGDNVYALVQGDTEGTYKLYRRETGWVFFGTNASIAYHLIQDVTEGTTTNVPSGKAVKDVTDLINIKIQLLASGVKVTLAASPSTIYKNVATNITLTGRMEKATPSQMQLLDGNTVLATSNVTPITHTLALNTSENTKAYQVKGTVNGVVFDSSITIQARNPIYYGFGANATSVAVDANRLAPTTSAVTTYTKTNATNGQHFYILVPSDITDVNTFTMGGAPFVMNPVTTQTIGGVTYKVHESGNIYNAGVTLKVSATV